MINTMAKDNRRGKTTSNALLSCLTAIMVGLSGCASITSSATQSLSDSLAVGIRNQDSIETVREGIPAYLLLIDGNILRNPDDGGLLLAGSEIYAAYAGVVDDRERARGLADKSKEYARRALCLRALDLCMASSRPFEEWEAALADANQDLVPELYRLSASWATVIQMADGDWDAIADIPKVEAAIERIVELSPRFESGWPQLYLGVLATLLPPAYGGKPEEGRKHFESAIELSAGNNLMAYVLFAEEYARLVFDQELHDDLLQSVLEKPVEQPDLTLVNTLARVRAHELLAGSADYF